jgi:CRISPR/Cas system endoribonuclease Cas6 (RAMP superfamily)
MGHQSCPNLNKLRFWNSEARYRVLFERYWDKTIVDRTQMQAVLHDAGKLVGLGDGRSIGFGRFTLVSFDLSDYAA